MGIQIFFKKKSAKSSKSSKTAKSSKKATPSKTYAQIGAEGEQEVYNYLCTVFGPNLVFRNVYIRRPSGMLTEVDLLAIHATGVFVVESKNYAGLVQGDGTKRDWLHIKSATYKRTFYSPVAQNKGHIDALREACGQHVGFIPPMLSLLVFPDHCSLQITNLPQGLRCCKFSQIPSMLNQVISMVTPVLSAQNIQVLAQLFYNSQRNMLPKEIQEQHMKDVAKIRKLLGN